MIITNIDMYPMTELEAMESLKAEIDAEYEADEKWEALCEELETYTEDMFENSEDWDDFNICSIEDEYVFRHKTITEILDMWHYNYSVKNTVDSFHTAHHIVTIKADENENIHWIRKALYNISLISGYSQFYKHDEYTLHNNYTIFIEYH